MGTMVIISRRQAMRFQLASGWKSRLLKKAEAVRCPHCLQVHRLAEIRAWLVQPKDGELAPVAAA
jgi:hypothetical protein